MNNLEKLNDIYHDSQKSAELVGLNYIEKNDLADEIIRLKKGQGFAYKDRDDNFVTSEDFKQRVEELNIPPSFENVRISSDPNSHLQAIAVDSNGRIQYFYHPKWREFRQLLNFFRVLLIGESLDEIRKTYESDLNSEDLTLQKACAAAIYLIDETLIRIGSDYYTKKNNSYGLSTLRSRHLTIDDGNIHIEYDSKSHQHRVVDLEDSQLAKVLDDMNSEPGYEIFKYYDEDGKKKDLKAKDINRYLKKVSGHNITVKDFRTWGGTKLFVEGLVYKHKQKDGGFENLNEIVDSVAEKLGNTKSVSKNYYIHPDLLFDDNDDFENFISTLKNSDDKDIKDVVLVYLKGLIEDRFEKII